MCWKITWPPLIHTSALKNSFVNQRKNNIFTDLNVFFNALNFRFRQVSQSFDSLFVIQYIYQTRFQKHCHSILLELKSLSSPFLGITIPMTKEETWSWSARSLVWKKIKQKIDHQTTSHFFALIRSVVFTYLNYITWLEWLCSRAYIITRAVNRTKCSTILSYLNVIQLSMFLAMICMWHVWKLDVRLHINFAFTKTKQKQEMSNDTLCPLTLTFDLVTPKSIGFIY